MRRCAVAAAVVAASVLLVAETARAFQCPVLIRTIYNEAGNRFDDGAYDATDKAAQAARLHRENRHQEAEMIALQGLIFLGVERPRETTSTPRTSLGVQSTVPSPRTRGR